MAHHNIAIACQGGGSHAAYAGALATLLPQFDPLDIRSVTANTPLKLVGLSGTSGGAITALLGWYGFLTCGAVEAERKLTAFWDANTARMPGESLFNTWSLSVADAMPYDLQFERASASLGSMLRGLAAPTNEPGTLTGMLPSIREDEGVRDTHLIVDELTVQHTSSQGGGEDVLGAHLDGAQIRIEGNTGLYRGGRAGHNWRLRNVVVETLTHLH